MKYSTILLLIAICSLSFIGSLKLKKKDEKQFLNTDSGSLEDLLKLPPLEYSADIEDMGCKCANNLKDIEKKLAKEAKVLDTMGIDTENGGNSTELQEIVGEAEKEIVVEEEIEEETEEETEEIEVIKQEPKVEPKVEPNTQEEPETLETIIIRSSNTTIKNGIYTILTRESPIGEKYHLSVFPAAPGKEKDPQILTISNVGKYTFFFRYDETDKTFTIIDVNNQKVLADMGEGGKPAIMEYKDNKGDRSKWRISIATDIIDYQLYYFINKETGRLFEIKDLSIEEGATIVASDVFTPDSKYYQLFSLLAES